MMEVAIEFVKNFWFLTNDMAIYIIFGVLFAGALKQLIPDNFVLRHLGKNTVGSVFKAAFFGIPLPLCSCSVIPFATTLKKEGASNGSVLAFLIATPITGVDSILATYGFFGWVFTLYRVGSSFVIAIVAGVVQNIFGEEKDFRLEAACSSCCCGESCTSSAKEKFSFKKMYEYAVFDIFGDFAKPLFWGLVIGAVLTTFLPEDLSAFLEGNLALTYLLVLLIALPMYICATASLPIAAGLIAAGISPGAAFVLLSAGPATNSVTMGVVLTALGKRALFIYLGTIGNFSLALGYGFDMFLGDVDLLRSGDAHENFGMIDMLASVLLLGLMGCFLIRRKL